MLKKSKERQMNKGLFQKFHYCVISLICATTTLKEFLRKRVKQDHHQRLPRFVRYNLKILHTDHDGNTNNTTTAANNAGTMVITVTRMFYRQAKNDGICVFGPTLSWQWHWQIPCLPPLADRLWPRPQSVLSTCPPCNHKLTLVLSFN